MRYVYSAAAIGVALVLLVPPALLAQVDPAKLAVSNYQLVNSTRYNRDQWYYTYAASLVNSGPATPAITATLTSAAPSIQVVSGQGVLHFPPAPAGGMVSSIDSFTILVDRTVPFDVGNLRWFFLNPIANAGPNQTVALGTTVTLNAGASSNPSGAGKLSFSWQFVSVPPGSKAALSNATSISPSFVADAGGRYVVGVTVSNGVGSDTATVTISTLNSPPVANAGPNQTVGILSTVTLNGSKSYDVDGDPLTYWWTFVSTPQKSAAVLYSQRSVSPYFVADVSGTYIIQLIVNDGQADSQPATVNISTANTPPSANAGSNQNVNVQSLVQLNGAGSTDVDGDPLTYRWRLNSTPAGSQATLSDPAAVNPTFTADKPGTYLVQLIVNDGKVDSQPATVSVTTNAIQAPTANAGYNQSVAHGKLVQLNGGGTDPQNLTLTYAWSMISQPQGSTASLSAKGISNPTFTADLPGTYVIQLIVNDGYLSSSPVTVTITTTDTAPVANPGTDQSVYTNATVYLDGSQSYDADNDSIISFSWTFTSKPAGSNATLSGANTKTPSFVADVNGAYVVQLIVADKYAVSDPKTVTINAGTNSIVFSPSPLTLYNAPQTVNISLTPIPSSPVVLNFSNFDTTVVDVPLTATVPANSSGVNITVTPKAPGSTKITANATGYYTSNLPVTVKMPTISIALQNGATGVGLSHGLDGTITLDAPAPSPNGAVISLSSTPSPEGAVTFDSTRITIPAGSYSGAFHITGSQLGTTTISAASGGYVTGNLTIQVVMLGGISLPVGLFVPYGHSVALNLQISTPAPVGGVTLTLASSDTSVLTVTPSSVFIKFGATAPDTAPQVSGVALGTAKVTASGDGLSSDSQNIKVMASVTFLPQAVSVSAGGVQMFHILLSAPAPTGGLLVNLTSDNSSVATATSQVWIYDPNESADANVSGVAPGATTIKASINSGLGFNQYFTTDTAVLSVTVGDLAITTSSLPAGTPGATYPATTLSASGGTRTGYSWSVFNGTLPTGLSLSSGGVLSGTISSSATSASVTIQVKDSAGNVATKTYAITINQPLGISPATLPAGMVGQAYSQTMNATGGVSPYTWSATNLPGTLTIGPSTGIIGGTPTAASSGAVTIKVTDGNGATATITPTLTITAALAISPATLAAGMVSQAYSQTMAATGGTSPYTWSATNLPNTLSIGSSSGTISGTPTAGFSGTVTIKVADANGFTASITPTLTITAALAISPTTLPAGMVNQAYSQAMTATGGTSPYTWSATDLPNTLTIGTSSGTIGGTPTAVFGGTVTIKVTDSKGASATITPTLNINAALALSPATLPAGMVNKPYSHTITATGGVSPYTWSATGLPNTLTIGASSGTISGTPTAVFSGAVTIKITDSNGASASITPILTITAALAISPTNLPSGMVNQAYSQTMTATGGASPYTWSATNLPSPLTIGAASGTISGTPTTAFSGTVTIKVTDANGATASITPTLTINGQMTISPATLPAGMVNQVYSQTMAATGGASPYTWSATGLPNTLTIGTSSGTIGGTPTAVFTGTVTIRVTDANGASATITPTLTVNAALSISPTTLPSGAVNQAYSQTMTASGGTSPYTWSATNLPNTLAIGSSSGTISGTPTAVFSAAVTIKVTDASGFTATISPTLTINAALAISPSTLPPAMVNKAYSQTMSASGGASPYTWSASNLPNTLTIGASSGTISGTPTAAFSGTVTIKVTDAHGATATITPTLTITAALAISPATLPAGMVNKAYSQTMTASGGASPYTWSASNLPNTLTIGASNGTISGTPTTAFSGTVTIKVTDANGFTATVTPTLAINAALAISPTTLPAGMVNQAYSQTMAVTGGASPYTWSATNLPSPLTIGASSGTISGTPTAAFSGTVTIQVTDANGASASITPTLTINGALVISPTTLPSGMVNKAYSQTMTATGGTSPYTWSATNLPNTLTIGSSSGVISGTPTAAFSGTVTIKVTDAHGATATIAPTLTINAALAISPTTLPSGMVNKAYSQAMTATGGMSPYTWSATGLPNTLTIGTSSGTISGTPTAVFGGAVTIKVTDANGATVTITPTLTITATLVISPTTLPAGTANQAYSQTMTATGGASPYTWSASSLPNTLTIGSSSGTISGTPTAAFSGTVTIKVTDAKGFTASITPTLTINAALAISPATLPTGVVNKAYSQTMTATGGASPYTWSATGLPNTLTIGSSSGTIGGTPTAVFNAAVTIKVTDANGASTFITPTLTINAALSISTGTLPAATPGAVYTSTTLTATGGTGKGYTWSITSGAPPSGLGLSSSGTISGTVGSTATTSTFTVQVQDDGSNKATRAFTITVNLAITTASLAAGQVNVAYTQTLSAGGGTPSYTWSSGTLPTWLQLNSVTGVLSGTPRSGGTWTISVTVTDSKSNTASKSFTITVAAGAPSFTTTSPLPNATVNASYSTQIAVTGGSPPYTWSTTGLPSWLTLDTTGTCGGSLSAPMLCGTPTALATVNFSITVTDSTNQQASKSFALTVTSGGTLGTITVSSASVGLNLQMPITITLSPAPAVDVTLTISSGTPGSVLLGSNSDAGSASLTPKLTAGTASVGTYVKALAASGTVTITASAPGYANGTGTITLGKAGFVVAAGSNGIGGSLTTYQRATTSLTIHAARLDSQGVFVEDQAVRGGLTVNVPLSSSPTSVGTVSTASVAFNGGDTTQPATFTASSTNTGNASIIVSPPSGFVPAFTNPSTGATINVTVLPNGLIAPTNITVGKNLQTSATVKINAPASSGVTVTLTSTDSRLQFASGGTSASYSTLNVIIPQNQTSTAEFYIRAYDSSGTIPYTISAPGYGQVSGSVTLGPSGFVIHTPAGFSSNFSMGLGGSDAELDIYTALYNTTGSFVQTQALAGDQSVIANLTVIPTTFGDVTAHQVTINGGSFYSPTFFHAASTGTAGVTASAVGYQSNSIQATVQASTLNISNGLTVGNFLEGQATVTLSAPAPSGGLAITLTSNSSLLKLAKNATDAGSNSIVVTVAQGASFGTYYVYALASTGTATYSASAPGYASNGDDTVTLVPSGVVIYPKDPTTLSLGGSSGFYVYTAQLSTDGSNTPITPQGLAGNATLNVSLTNSNPAIGTVNGSSNGTVSIGIAPGTNGTTATFASKASGSATVSVTQPTGWALPSALQQLGFLVL